MSNNKDKIIGSLAILFWILYLGMGILQFLCLYTYITERWFDIPILSFIVSIFIAYFPIVGTIFGYIGAIEIFNWNAVFSFLLFLFTPIKFFFNYYN